jgi:hypothetical protein
LLRNFEAVKSKIEQSNIEKEPFFSYLLDYVEFWYFDTNISEQGEELYNFMNARGEQVQLNENIKADLLGKLNISDAWTRTVFQREEYQKDYTDTIGDFKNYWGPKWEDWQDYFWTKISKRMKKQPWRRNKRKRNKYVYYK